MVNKTNGLTLNTTALSVNIGNTAGLAIAPDGTFYLADGGVGGTNELYTLKANTGVLTAIGPLGDPQGLSGLAYFNLQKTLRSQLL